MAIRLPGEKRAGATPLFDEIFACFGSRNLRLITLQRIRGNPEHFESTNTMWNFFTAHVDALLGCADEAGIRINCGFPHVWMALWESMKVLICLRKDGRKWADIFKGSLERLLPAEQRFARHQYPQNVIWVSGDATLNTVAGVSWFGREYFVCDAPPLIREMKRDVQDEIIIGECELLVSILGALLWGFAMDHIVSLFFALTTTTCSLGCQSGRPRWAPQADSSEL